jgi:hypothetical protein
MSALDRQEQNPPPPLGDSSVRKIPLARQLPEVGDRKHAFDIALYR